MATDTLPFSAEYGFLSSKWRGCKSLNDLNGDRKKYRGVLVDVVDLRTNKRIGRMVLGSALVKFN